MQVLMNMPPEHQNSQHSGYGQSSWMSVQNAYSSSPQTTMSPMHEFPPFEYHSTTPMPMEPSYNMPRTSPFASSHAQMPPPLIMPQSGLWPSMLASQHQPPYQTPILPSGILHTPLSASTGSDMTPTSAKTPSRRKLTDEERRQMCIEAEQNPTMKQTQIGAKFNVERSTVSKILRQRDKYMNPQPKHENANPGKKSKAKLPDFEKTLTNWVKNQQKKGMPVSDEDLRKQAQVFSFSRNDQTVLSSVAWLEKFKRKNHLGVSNPNGDEALLDSNTTSLAETSVDNSPMSSSGLVSPPMSAIEESGTDARVKMQTGPDFFDFEERSPFRRIPKLENQPASEMAHLTQESMLSPISPEVARRDPEGVSFLGDAQDQTESSNRQRSQTYPHLPDFGTSGSRPSSSDKKKAPSLPVRSLTNTSPETRPAAIDPRQMMKRHKSVPDIHYPEQVQTSSMQPPPLPKSADTSPISNPASPAEDDNIRALHAIKALLEQNPNVAEPDDYLAIGKLMQKMKLLRPASSTLPGGLHAIDIMESPRISKKRTILGIST